MKTCTSLSATYNFKMSWAVFCIIFDFGVGHAAGGVVSGGTALQAGMSRIRFPVGSLVFLIDLIPPVALWP